MIIIWVEWCLSRVFGIPLQIHQKILAWVRPPPFWQCQDFESAYPGDPSLRAPVGANKSFFLLQIFRLSTQPFLWEEGWRWRKGKAAKCQLTTRARTSIYWQVNQFSPFSCLHLYFEFGFGCMFVWWCDLKLDFYWQINQNFQFSSMGLYLDLDFDLGLDLYCQVDRVWGIFTFSRFSAICLAFDANIDAREKLAL